VVEGDLQLLLLVWDVCCTLMTDLLQRERESEMMTNEKVSLG